MSAESAEIQMYLWLRAKRQGLCAGAIAGVARGISDEIVTRVSKVLCHLGFQCPLHQLLG